MATGGGHLAAQAPGLIWAVYGPGRSGTAVALNVSRLELCGSDAERTSPRRGRSRVMKKPKCPTCGSPRRPVELARQVASLRYHGRWKGGR
jgi:hypothetical protein